MSRYKLGKHIQSLDSGFLDVLIGHLERNVRATVEQDKREIIQSTLNGIRWNARKSC
jgi:hypothetical protein